MHSIATVDLAASTPVLTQAHRCDDLIECDPLSGEVLRRCRGRTADMKFLLVAAEPTVVIRMACKYADPLASPAHGIDEMEYKGTIEINPAAGTINVDLMICLFPAFEGYMVINEEFDSCLFRYAPPAGILALGPPRGAKRPIRWRMDDRQRSAVFEPPDVESA